MGGWGGGEDAPQTKREITEAANGRAQIAYVRSLVEAPGPHALTPECLLELNRLVVDGLVDRPGLYRLEDVEILGSRHDPPGWADVPVLVEQACDYINGERDAIVAAAYALWRINWVHPFENGNGRTARAACYLVLCWRTGVLIPGEPTLPERMTMEKFAYNDGLEDADHIFKNGRVDVSMLSGWLGDLLVAQLDE